MAAKQKSKFACIQCMSYDADYTEDGYWDCEQCGEEDVAVLWADTDTSGAPCWKSPTETTTDCDPVDDLDPDCVNGPLDSDVPYELEGYPRY